MQKIYTLDFKILPSLFNHQKGILAILILMLFGTSYKVNAQIIWNGPSITFSKAGGADWTQPSNQDRITANVWITRKSSEGIFNINSEGGYTHDLSPAGTEWATGSLANYASLTYKPWEVWHGDKTRPPLNTDVVLHLIAENIYLNLRFLSWGTAGSGAFSYSRTTAATLPVTLKSFSVSVKNNSSILQWITSTEINNKFFNIEHSADGKSFNTVGTVNGKGNTTNESSYTFTHNNMVSGRNFYRLAQHDFDGAVKYSQVIFVSVNNSGGVLQVKPNPANAFINLTASAALTGAKYYITSSAGQVVKQGVLSSQQIDVQKLSAGQFWLKIFTAEGEPLQTTFIKN